MLFTFENPDFLSTIKIVLSEKILKKIVHNLFFLKKKITVLDRIVYVYYLTDTILCIKSLPETQRVDIVR